MQWIIGHRPKFCLLVIYIGYWSAVDSLEWNVESTLELYYKGASTFIGPSGPYSKLIYHNDTIYEGWIDSTFIIVNKDILVIM